jgi:sarcosine oxidase
MDPRAGYSIRKRSRRAAEVAAGAQAHFDEPVIDWSADDEGVRVETRSGEYSGSRLVLCAGAWTARVARVPELELTIERQSVFWFDPGASLDYESDRFPIYAYEFKPGTICYGFPRLPRGVKASVMHDGENVADPDRVERLVRAPEAEALRRALRPILPALSESAVCETAVCLFTNTSDQDFVIDFHPRHSNVLVSSPCSGHGFKFASAIGEAQAELVVDGKTGFDLSPFRIKR